MIYVALLRGINVGGNNKVNMKQLKLTFEGLGLQNVRTYINSGNVIFSDNTHSAHQLAGILEKAIDKDFGLEIKVLLRSFDNLKKVGQALPKEWVNDESMKCDVMFLWQAADNPKVIAQLPLKQEIDEVRYTPGAVLWRVDRDKVTRSGMSKLVGTPLYKQMTIRNCNTFRKLLALMQEIEA